MCEMILSEARLHAPVELGELRDSEGKNLLHLSGDEARWEIGFSENYAEVQDQGWKTRIIRPMNTSALFIPLTRRARRAGSSNWLGLDEGTDYIMRNQVKAPRMRRYGSDIGPNRFFSGTIKRMTRNRRQFRQRVARAWVALMRAQGLI